MASFTPTANPAAISAVQDILREVWVSDKLESQLYEDTILLDWVEDITDYTDSDGLKASLPVRTGRTAGVGARGVGEQLAAADHQRVGKASYNYTNQYLQVQVNGPVVARMETNRQSAVKEVTFEVDNGILDFKKDLCRQLHGDGSAAITGALPGGVSSTTVLLGAANYFAIDKGWLYEGMPIDIGTAANPVLDTGGNRIVSIVDSATAPAIVVANATATTAGSKISRYGNRIATNVSYEMNGLQNLADDTAIVGALDPATATYWKSKVVSNAGTPRALTVDLMLTAERGVRQFGEKVEAVLTGLIQEQKYYNLLQSQVRFAGDQKLSAGNSTGLDFHGKIVLGDPEALDDRMYFLNKKSLIMLSAGKIAWQNQTTGGDVLAWVQNYDAFLGRAAKYGQLGTNRRRSLGVLKDLAIT